MTQANADALAAALAARFPGEVELEQVAPGRFRFSIVSSAFSGISPLARQDLAWDVVDRTLSSDETTDISLVITLSPEELQAA